MGIKIHCREVLDKPRIETHKIDITCIEKYQSYISHLDGEHIKSCDIFKILDIIKDKILQLEHDDTMTIEISSNFYWKIEEQDLDKVLREHKMSRLKEILNTVRYAQRTGNMNNEKLKSLNEYAEEIEKMFTEQIDEKRVLDVEKILNIIRINDVDCMIPLDKFKEDVLKLYEKESKV